MTQFDGRKQGNHLIGNLMEALSMASSRPEAVQILKNANAIQRTALMETVSAQSDITIGQLCNLLERKNILDY